MDTFGTFTRRSLLGSGFGVTAAAMVGAPILAACGDDSESQTGLKLTSMSIQFNWINYVQWAGSYIADNDGYYAEELLNVNFLGGGPNVDYINSIKSGRALVGFGDFSEMAVLNNQGADFVMLAAMYQRNPTCVLSRADNPIETPADVIGTRLGLNPYSREIWETFAPTVGLDPFDIEDITIGADPAPLAAGEIDAMLAFVIEQPVALEVSGVPAHTFLLADHGYNLYTMPYATVRSALDDEESRDVIKRWMRADLRGQVGLLRDPEHAARLTVDKYAADLGHDFDGQKRSAELAQQLYLSPETEEYGIGWMGGEGLAQSIALTDLVNDVKIPDVDEYVDLTLLREIYEEDPSIAALPS